MVTELKRFCLRAGPVLQGSPPSEQDIMALAQQLAQTLSLRGGPTRATATAPISASFQPPGAQATDSVPAFASNFVPQLSSSPGTPGASLQSPTAAG